MRHLSGFIAWLLLLSPAQAVTFFWADTNAVGTVTGYVVRNGVVGSTVTNVVNVPATLPHEYEYTNLAIGGYFWWNTTATNATSQAISTNVLASLPAPMQALTMPSPTSLQWKDTNSAPDISSYIVRFGQPGQTNETILTLAQVTRAGVAGNRTVTYNGFSGPAAWITVVAKNQFLESDVTQILLPPYAPIGLGLR